MKKKIFVRGPVLSQSGYGEQSRFALRALRSREDLFDIYIQPIPWGQTGWIWEESEFREWMDSRIFETQVLVQQKTLQPDISLQITIPNEFEKLCPINIGYTAGIETTMVDPSWLQKGNEMDKILVVSQHAKDSYVGTNAQAQNRQTGETLPYNLETPVEVVWENTPMSTKAEKIPGFNPRSDFNFLCVSQMGPRKNLENTIKWFVEEFIDQEVGLILKTNTRGNSKIDLEHTEGVLKAILASYPERKCNVSLLHGDLTEGQMRALYEHDKVKAMINISHGEGFGLPLFEAARHGLPIISVGWSGQLDFLRHDDKDMFLRVKHELKPIQQHAVWKGVLRPDSQWAYADQGSYKMALRMMFKKHGEFLKQAEELRHLVEEKFCDEVLFQGFCDSILGYKRGHIEPIQSISFCIPTNAAKPEKLMKTIKAIRKEADGFDYEVVIAGNVESLDFLDGDVILVDKKQEALSGHVATLRNASADSSSKSCIVWLDDDIVLGEGWLGSMLEYSKENDWNVLSSRILNPDGSRHWDRATLNPHMLVDYDTPQYKKGLYQTSGLIMVRRKVYEQVRWDDNAVIHSGKSGSIPEDVRYSFDLSSKGFTLSFNKNAVVWHNDERYTEFEERTLLKELISANRNVMFPPDSKKFASLLKEVS
jgi:glycosyltransferase involved in cell wall biosynthesis